MNGSILLETGSSRWGDAASVVSLHGHTLCSRESLSFINKLARRVAPVRMALVRGAARYRAAHGRDLDLRRGWWTPPLAPHDAWLLEKNAIERRFEAPALVSLTDHDNIEAPLTLRVLEGCRDLPVSVEWTVPHGAASFHLGVHNLPADSARASLAAMREYTLKPRLARLLELLEWLAAQPEILVVFNHPCWDGNRIGYDAHLDAVRAFLVEAGGFLQALELNGLRSWSENRAVIALAEESGMTLVSGGDRHALEPNTILNLSRARTFAGFVDEIRSGHSRVLITAAYQECLALRILRSVEQVLATQESHAFGWRRWDDRVFYTAHDGVARPLSALWGRRTPLVVRAFVRGVQLMRQPLVRGAFRSMFGGEEIVS